LQSKLHSIAQGAEAQGLNDHISVRVVRLSEALARIATRTIEQRWGLKNTDLRILNTLDGLDDGLPVSELARRVHVDKGWISRSVRELEGRGLVVTRPDPADPRRMLVALSGEGRERLELVRPFALQGELALLEGLDARLLKAMLERLEANAASMLEGLE
jgi:DNA-binding MarR family transcriptional regulator